MDEANYYPYGLTMSGISSKAVGSLENKRGYNGNELQNEEWNDGSGLELYDFNARTYDQQIGRFIQVDPLMELYQEHLSPYHYAFNNPVTFGDPDGKFPFFPGLTNWAVGQVIKDPNSNTSKALGVAAGVGSFVQKTAEGAINMVAHPINTLQGFAEMGSPVGQMQFGMNLVNTVKERANAIQNGTGFESFAAGTESFLDVASIIAGSKGLGSAVKGTKQVAGLADDVASKGRLEMLQQEHKLLISQQKWKAGPILLLVVVDDSLKNILNQLAEAERGGLTLT